MDIECVVPPGADLGEGPVWSAREQALYWVDINAPALHRYDPASGKDRHWPMPEMIGCVALSPDARVVVALASGLAWFDPDTETLTPFLPIEADIPERRLNDGRVDRQGRLWVGSMQRASPRKPEGVLYRCTAGQAVPVLTGITVPNSLSFSPDGRVMYFADTPTHRVRAFDLDPDGTLRGERLFATVADGEGAPDGAAIDAEGCLWVAHHSGWRLTRHRPDGTVDRVVMLPVQRPTCCAFGGRDLDTLYITSANDGLDPAALSRGPLAGALLAFRPGVRGVPEELFGETNKKET